MQEVSMGLLSAFQAWSGGKGGSSSLGVICLYAGRSCKLMVTVLCSCVELSIRHELLDAAERYRYSCFEQPPVACDVYALSVSMYWQHDG